MEKVKTMGLYSTTYSTECRVYRKINSLPTIALGDSTRQLKVVVKVTLN